MGKRYGRNQKRRHVEEIKTLRRDIEVNDKIYQGTITITQAKLNRARRNTEEMVSMIERVCEYSSVLSAKKLEGNSVHDTFRLPIRQQKTLASQFIPGHDMLERTWSESWVNLHALKIYIDDHYEAFSKCVHMQYCNSRSVYLISEEALLTTPTEELSKYIIPNIVRDLIHHTKKALKK